MKLKLPSKKGKDKKQKSENIQLFKDKDRRYGKYYLDFFILQSKDRPSVWPTFNISQIADMLEMQKGTLP